MTKIAIGLAAAAAAFLVFAFLSANSGTARAACVKECGAWSAWSCVKCKRTCTRKRLCIFTNCTSDYETQTEVRSCDPGYTVCEACTCAGRRECCSPCTDACKIFTCAKPAGCNTPSPTKTPTPTPTGDWCTPLKEGNCHNDQECKSLGEPWGETCITTKEKGVCWCTKKTDPVAGGYSCEPYRDFQIVGGVCYQQWKCKKTVTTTLPDGTKITEVLYFYQIRQTCDPVGGGGGDGGGAPTCSVNLSPSSATLAGGSLVSLTANVTTSDSIDYVSFSSADAGVASVSPSTDSTIENSFATIATAISAGSTSISASVVMSGSSRCTNTSDLTITPPGAWWQVKDTDILANESLIKNSPRYV